MQSLYGQSWGHLKEQLSCYFLICPCFFQTLFDTNVAQGSTLSQSSLISVRASMSSQPEPFVLKDVTQEVTCMQVGHSHGLHFHLQSCPTPAERWSKMFRQNTHSNRLGQSKSRV